MPSKKTVLSIVEDVLRLAPSAEDDALVTVAKLDVILAKYADNYAPPIRDFGCEESNARYQHLRRRLGVQVSAVGRTLPEAGTAVPCAATVWPKQEHV